MINDKKYHQIKNLKNYQKGYDIVEVKNINKYSNYQLIKKTNKFFAKNIIKLILFIFTMSFIKVFIELKNNMDRNFGLIYIIVYITIFCFKYIYIKFKASCFYLKDIKNIKLSDDILQGKIKKILICIFLISSRMVYFYIPVSIAKGQAIYSTENIVVELIFIILFILTVINLGHFWLRYSYSLELIIFDNYNPNEAIDKSQELTKFDVWSMYKIYFILFAIYFGTNLIFNTYINKIFLHSEFYLHTIFLQCVIIRFVVAYSYALFSIKYMNLRDCKENT